MFLYKKLKIILFIYLTFASLRLYYFRCFIFQEKTMYRIQMVLGKKSVYGSKKYYSFSECLEEVQKLRKISEENGFHIDYLVDPM